MRFPGNVVTIGDTRSGNGGHGKPEKCFYCSAPTGGPHKDECVCIDRPVRIKFTLDLVMAVPRSWSKDDIEFRYNEGSWCGDNILPDIERHVARENGSGECLCHRLNAEYIGEATIEEAVAANLTPETEDE